MLTEQVHQLLLVYAAYLIAVASPGPSTMAIMSTAMRSGRSDAIPLALGVVTGSMFWGILAATGISTVLTAYAQAVLAIKIVGGIYLLFLAWKSARSALAADARGINFAPAGKSRLYRRGMLLHLSNPKAILGWIAIMSLGLGQEAKLSTMLAIVAGCAVLGLVVNVGYALIFSTAVMARAYGKARRWIEGTLATIFGYAGLRLLLSRA